MNHLNSPNLTRCNPQWTLQTHLNPLHFISRILSNEITYSLRFSVYQICFCLKNMMLAVRSSRNALLVAGTLFHRSTQEALSSEMFSLKLQWRCPNIPHLYTFSPLTRIFLWWFLGPPLSFPHSPPCDRAPPTLLCNCLLIQATLPHPWPYSRWGVTRVCRNLPTPSHPLVSVFSAKNVQIVSRTIHFTNKQTNKKHSESFWFPSGIQQMLSTCYPPLRSQGQRQILRGKWERVGG